MEVPRLVTTNQSTSPFQFTIAATFTADPLRPVIGFWARQLGAIFESRFAPYNQVLQSVLDPSSILARNTHGVNIVLLRLEDLGQTPEQIAENVRHVAAELHAAPSRFAVPLIVCLCPSLHAFEPAHTAQMEALLEAALSETPGAQFIPHTAVDRLYPVENPHSPEGERLGRIPYTEAYFCALGTMLVRHTHALLRQPFKLIALDCDNTLWQGICGEDGPENVRLDEPRRVLHEFMIDQREDGVLLTMASKNNEEDVLETFRVHEEMPLQPRHFVTWRINWDTKAENLVSISEQLSLGLDSFIFVDDNPKECAELQEALPEVLTLALPEDISRTPHFLDHVWAFDHPVVTVEDRKRSAYYQQQAEFGNAVRQAGSFAGFIESLNLRIDIRPVTPATLPRVAQLTQRTNQFNTTGIRRTEADIQKLLDQGWRIFTADVADRFGDYGLVGVMILAPTDGGVDIESLLLSCRALGRGVEHRMVAYAAQFGEVSIPFRKTAKNQPAEQFIESLKSWRGDWRNLEWRPAPAAATVRPRVAPSTQSRAVDYACIANQLSTVPEILAAMRNGVAVHDATMSETERALAGIWADLLDKREIRREDNFFDLGGHSLVAVLLLMRIRETFGVELPIDDVYTGGLTLADLAARIESEQAGGTDPAEYASLLAEIENLTDEEARELLAREDGLS